MDGFESREGVTIFEGNRRSGTEEVAPYAALFLCLRVAWKSKQKQAAYEFTEEAYVCVFVTTTIPTWMNGN